MKIRRDVASVPLRSAKETWDAIIDLVSGSGTVDGDQLEDARSVMECVIADEQPGTVPIVLKGGGPRVVIYCVYNEDAMEVGLDVDKLIDVPTAGNWRLMAPCEEEDKEWMNNSLKENANRVTVYAANEPPMEEEEETAEPSSVLKVDWSKVRLS